jgi:N-hydroxyarylamine O-acetyltransferase
VLARLGFANRPEPSFERLCAIYSAWCQRVPFDNVRKLIYLRAGNDGPLPGSTADDFFEAWLESGVGGTCWPGACALHALLASLGFRVARGIATMMVAPNLPPNHGSVLVSFDDARWLVDSSILHGEPLRLEEHSATTVAHPAWGVRCCARDGHWHITWRPLHKLEGLECRTERIDASGEEFRNLYEQTRVWSAFNFEVAARLNRGQGVTGLAFGHAIELRGDGSTSRTPVAHEERVRFLIEDLGFSEQILRRLPHDAPTPPPPWSRTAGSRE